MTRRAPSSIPRDAARALVTVVASDADNRYITMSARFLVEKLFIVARAEDEAAVEKMKRAGASRSTASNPSAAPEQAPDQMA